MRVSNLILATSSIFKMMCDDGTWIVVDYAGILCFLKKVGSVSSELELQSILENSNEPFAVFSEKKCIFKTKQLTSLGVSDINILDYDDDTKICHLSVNGENLVTSATQICIESYRPLTILHLPSLSFIDININLNSEANLIVCNSDMRVLKISPNLVSALKLKNVHGKHLSEIGHIDIGTDGTKQMFINKVEFQITKEVVENGKIAYQLVKIPEDVIESKLFPPVSRWNQFNAEYTLAIIDVSSLKLMNLSNGAAFGDKCIKDIYNIIRLEDTSAHLAVFDGGALLYTSIRTGLEVQQLLEDAKSRVSMQYDFKFSIVTSSEFGPESKVDKFDTFKVMLRTARQHLVWYKSSNKCITEHTLTSIMFLTTPETKSHCKRISKISLILAEYFNWITPQDKSEIAMGATLHDFGKTFIPNEIINKPGVLSEQEFAIMKTHPEKGAAVFKDSKTLQLVHSIILNHHERYDGKGYPNGVSTKDLHIAVSIVSLVDSVDAMLSTRCYKEAKTISYVISELRKFSGSQFHPEVVKAFISAYKEGRLNGLLNIEKGDIA